MKSQKISGKEHIVYDDKGEFESCFMHESGAVPNLAKDWRRAKEGDWVEADDGGIVQILRQRPLPHPHDKKNYKLHLGWCRTVVGSFIQSDKYKMDTDFTIHPNRYRFGSESNAENRERVKNRVNPTKRERIFALALATGKSLQMAYEEAYGAKTHWREKALEIVKRDVVMTEVRKNVTEIAKKHGIDMEFIIVAFKDMYSGAEDENVQFRALKELRDIIQPKETIKSSLEGKAIFQFQGFDQDKLDEIEKDELKTKAEVIDEST